jgi:hypothetical protein
MTAKKIAGVAVAVLLFVVIYSTTFARSPVQAVANCPQVIDQIARDHQAFQRKVADDGMRFLLDDTVSTASAGLTPILADSSDPTLALASKVQTYKEEFESSQARYEKWRVTFKELVTCIDTKGCSLVDMVRRQNKALQEWFESLTDEGTQAAIERVRKASSLLQNYTSRLAGTAQGGMSAAVSCMNQYQERAHQLAEPVHLGNPPATQPKPEQPKPKSPPEQPKPKSGGPSTSTLVDLGLAAGGAVVGGAVLAHAIGNQAPDCTLQETAAMNATTSMQNAITSLSACGGNTSCLNAREGALNSAMQPLLNALSNLCTCMGSSVGSQFSASEKAAIQQFWSQLRSMGFNPGTLPSCFQ